MEVLRKRSHRFCACHEHDFCSSCSVHMLNGPSESLTNHHRANGTTHIPSYNDIKMCTGTATDDYHNDSCEDGHVIAQKRRCNGVSNYFLPKIQADDVCASNHSSPSSNLQHGAVSSHETFVAYENNATSCTTFQTYSALRSYKMPTVPKNLKNTQTVVCQRCLAGEPGHIRHIM